jgi:hypothetical protein
VPQPPENGFIEAKNEKKGRIYHLSVSFSRKIGQTTDYSRVNGINRAQHEDKVIQYINSHKRIERKHVMGLCDLSMGTPPKWTYYVKS